MIITGLAIAATTATKWLVVSKVATAVGGCMLTAHPIIEAIKDKKENGGK